ncbi:MAG: hypothetical protein L0G94_00360 [Brachybacterium sp.]|uniref:hypothetical protein n=1 Tax=Brachybacterium sp. TaxID=1891286 RepID=UPI002649EBEF|nr:hypothetical protein [Brachybacterium sp.]MDN5685124.1 hypothetical protein [Brachybacterium sp.]
MTLGRCSLSPEQRRELVGEATALAEDSDMVRRRRTVWDPGTVHVGQMNVHVYADRWADRSNQMRSLAEKAQCSTGAALEELDRITPMTARHGTSHERFEAYQLCRWLERSNEELAEEWNQGR